MMREVCILLMLCLSTSGVPRLTRKPKSGSRNMEVLFNFLPEYQKERNFQDVTYSVLDLVEGEEGGGDSPRTLIPPDIVVFPESEPLSTVDCLASSLPMKLTVATTTTTTTTAQPMRKWVHKWSQHCRRPRGQFRYPDDCHAYVDCWDGAGRLQYCQPRDLVFNEATGRCDWPRNVPCVIGTIPAASPPAPANSPNKPLELNLELPDCSDYAALGYKCVNFWECSAANTIIDNPSAFYGEGQVDARMVPPKRPKPASTGRPPSGVFDPLAKKCPSTYQICCRGQCKVAVASSSNNAGTATKLAAPQAATLCPADYFGPRPIPGICTKFADCYKGTATIKDCPPGTHFCRVSLMCDWPRKAVCEQLAAIAALRSPRDSAQSDEPTYILVHGSKTATTTTAPPPLSTARPLDATADLASGQYAHARNAGRTLPAPPSGQTIRLRQGKSPSEGYLQLFYNNQWGYVCDSGTWSLTEAAIVCHQLGLNRGVRKTTQGLVHGPVEDQLKATEHVDCTGSEDRLQACQIVTEPTPGLNSGKPCQLSEDIVSVSCLPDSWAACEAGEIPWRGSCYSFFPNATSFDLAAEACKAVPGRHLVEIESQEENDLLSELLYQNSRVTNLMDEVWTGGVGSNIARKNVWFWHSDTDKLMEYRNFWKGWSGGQKTTLEIKSNFAQGIKLSRRFQLVQKYNKKVDRLTDYYFWSLENFDRKLTYICERPQLDIGCIVDEGSDYRGVAKRTRYGDSCLSWDTPEIGFWFDAEQIRHLGPLTKENRFCRNPDEADAPWCLVGKGEYELCDIPQCGTESTPATQVPAPPKTTCRSDQFECQPGECIFSGYVCDEERDCSNGADENPAAKCNRYAQAFKKVPSVRLAVEAAEKWTGRSLEACLRTCVIAKEIRCRGVNYQAKEKSCLLLESNVGLSGLLEEDHSWTYFEKLDTQVTCAENLRCSSGKCLNGTQFCDGKYDCPDQRDETGCAKQPNLQVRLVGGKTPNEGRVEVKAFDYGWGGICDDGFGIQDAHVVCRHAGYPLGALEAVLHSKYGGGKDINLDELDCQGEESSLLECKFNPWRQHDCSPKEHAGVICRDASAACLEEEWRCKSSGECISLDVLCDTTQDCADGSDEATAQCQQPVAVRLTGGNNVTSGRVEVKYKGVWGSICDDNFGAEEGRVLCRMLGFPGGAKIHPEAVFGPGTGPIWVNNILCHGNETRLTDCPAPAWGPSYQCKHLEDVGIECLLKAADDTLFSPVGGGSEASAATAGGKSLHPAEQCGLAGVEFKPSAPVAKVAGGQTAAPGSQPWTASIRVRGSTKTFHWCGAAIIGEHHLLTAAHCVEDYPKDVYVIRVGDWDQDIEDADEQEFSIQSVHFHPDFNVGLYLNNDLAVVRIKAVSARGGTAAGGHGIKFGERVRAACLPPPNTAYSPGMECTISGWGSLGQGSGGYSRRLQAARVPLLPTEECLRKHVYGPDKLSGGMFCAGFLEGGVDSCQGDSGGPMVCEIRGRHTLLGIISWGYGCGRPNKPGVYTRVANYLDWIQEIVNT